MEMSHQKVENAGEYPEKEPTNRRKRRAFRKVKVHGTKGVKIPIFIGVSQMAREIHSHKVNALNEVLKIVAFDEPGVGGANHVYDVIPTVGNAKGVRIEFQNGPLKESHPNGLSNESLLAIVEDRLVGFQSGKFSCRENAIALTKIQEAMMWLQKRTRDRMACGVEGTLNK